VLAAATPSAIRRWIGLLVASGHLERYESDDGYPLLRVARTDDPPRIAAVPAAPANGGAASPADEALFERLRAWRRETAAAAAVPPYVVLADKTLRALAAARPTEAGELATVPGIGPAKLERYGTALLELMEAPPE
jgi:superfamily II DNA helicase RecQ